MLPVMCNSNILVAHEFTVADTDCEHPSVETPREPQMATTRDQVHNTPLRTTDISPLSTFCWEGQKTNTCGGSAQVIISSSWKNLVEDAGKKFVNKKRYQSKAQEEKCKETWKFINTYLDRSGDPVKQ
jgi:hypothetical protein